ncbi:c-type cytochrome, partial [Shewanella sp. 0m-11]
ADDEVTKELTTAPLGDLAMNELLTMGEKVYMTSCAACHQAAGTGLPPAFPSLVGSPIIKGPVAAHLDIVINGKPGTAMQSFSALLTPQQLAAVVTYERNAWGNNSGDAVQASDVDGHGK